MTAYQGGIITVGNSESLFQNFDHENFWNDMRRWSKNNLVFISEWKAPKDFKKIWSACSTVATGQTSKKYTDNLYVHKSIYDQISARTKRLIKNVV